MKKFKPDYRNLIKAATNNKPARIPLYEHIISEKIMEQILNKNFVDLYNGNREDKREYFRNYISFFEEMGYDTVSFERCIGSVMPGSGALGQNKPGVIKTREDFNNYPWEFIAEKFFDVYSEDFKILGEEMPEGMKAVGGPGNGVFECVQDIVGYTQLSYISVDDPKLYDDLFKKVGKVIVEIWKQFLEKFGDLYAVCRFGDDLGFKTSTLISDKDIKTKVIPQYERIIKEIHNYKKPFLLHSCGNIFSVMEELIEVAKIDAKHSNEDQIAPFSVWINKYGDRIGNFGGIDTDVLCRKNEKEIKEYVRTVFEYCRINKGIAIGSGNSIPEYVPPAGYLTMVEEVRKLRS